MRKASTIYRLAGGLAAAVGMMAVIVPAPAGAEGEEWPGGVCKLPPNTSANCDVTFPPRTIKPSDTEDTGWYMCPPDYPFLRDVPAGDPGWVSGSEKIGDGAIAILMKGYRTEVNGWRLGVGGTYFFNGSTVTNWDPTQARTFQVRLHCSRDINQAFGGTAVPGHPRSSSKTPQ